MIKTVLILAVVLCTATAVAQESTANTGFYPVGYSGTVFTGTVTQATTESITLTYADGSKTDTFVGVLRYACAVPRAGGNGKRMEQSEFPVGAVVSAYYIPVTRKVNGEKRKQNEIFAISFVEYNGQRVAKQLLFSCLASGTPLVMRVFSGTGAIIPWSSQAAP